MSFREVETYQPVCDGCDLDYGESPWPMEEAEAKAFIVAHPYCYDCESAFANEVKS